MMKNKSRILVAPLNWGLGHATRCIPIIRALLREGHEVIIASDGEALLLLQKEFPNLESLALPSYDITYSTTRRFFKLKMLWQSGNIKRTIQKEHTAVSRIIKEYRITGILSDNRLGLYTNEIPTVIITHQLKVLSGITTPLSTAIHRRYLKKFTECWVPDYDTDKNLSGILGHPKKRLSNIKYIGPLSRFSKKETPFKYDITAILSGPEPQRTLLEEKLRDSLKTSKKRVLLVQGVITATQKQSQDGNLEVVNFLTSQELERTLNSSHLIISRSGYTTIMDLASLHKKAFFIPTPGQPEQEYLARLLHTQKIAPYCSQDDFEMKLLDTLNDYTGFTEHTPQEERELSRFFALFEGKGEF